jgi:hypothetical protein
MGQAYSGDLPDGQSEIFFRADLDSPNTIERPTEFRFFGYISERPFLLGANA